MLYLQVSSCCANWRVWMFSCEIGFNLPCFNGLHFRYFVGLHFRYFVGLHFRNFFGFHFDCFIDLHFDCFIGFHFNWFIGFHLPCFIIIITFLQHFIYGKQSVLYSSVLYRHSFYSNINLHICFIYDYLLKCKDTNDHGITKDITIIVNPRIIAAVFNVRGKAVVVPCHIS